MKWGGFEASNGPSSNIELWEDGHRKSPSHQRSRRESSAKRPVHEYALVSMFTGRSAGPVSSFWATTCVDGACVIFEILLGLERNRWVDFLFVRLMCSGVLKTKRME